MVGAGELEPPSREATDFKSAALGIDDGMSTKAREQLFLFLLW